MTPLHSDWFLPELLNLRFLTFQVGAELCGQSCPGSTPPLTWYTEQCCVLFLGERIYRFHQIIEMIFDDPKHLQTPGCQRPGEVPSSSHILGFYIYGMKNPQRPESSANASVNTVD